MDRTFNIDDDLFAKAVQLSGINEESALLREALKALIERESAKQSARLGGSEPDLLAGTRRKSLVK